MTYRSQKVVLLHEDLRYAPGLEYSFESLSQSVRSRLPSLDPNLHISLLDSVHEGEEQPDPAQQGAAQFFILFILTSLLQSSLCAALCSLTMVFLSGLHQCEL